MIELRQASHEDHVFLRDVYASTRQEELNLTDWDESQKTAFCQQQFEAQDFHYRTYYPNARFQIILYDGNRIGRLYIDSWPQEIRMMDIALLPNYRGKGVGTYLLNLLKDEAKGQKKSLSVHVEKFNPAFEWYQKMGFVLIEDKGVYCLLEWKSI